MPALLWLISVAVSLGIGYMLRGVLANQATRTDHVVTVGLTSDYWYTWTCSCGRKSQLGKFYYGRDAEHAGEKHAREAADTK